jgi:hypothetical protein
MRSLYRARSPTVDHTSLVPAIGARAPFLPATSSPGGRPVVVEVISSGVKICSARKSPYGCCAASSTICATSR